MPRMGRFLLLALPGALLAILFIYLPFAGAIGLGFVRMQTIVSRPSFVGVANFADALGDPAFWNAFRNGVVYAGGSIGLQVVLGVSFALVLKEVFPGRGLLRGVIIFPYVVPTVVGVVVWRWMLNGNSGVVNHLFEQAGLHIPWLSTPTWAMTTVVIISVWLWTPFVTVAVLAALQTVSEELHEVARLDGAGALRRFWHVTLPGIAPILVVVALLRGIWMFNKFDIIYLTTGGGPLHSTEHLPVLAYRKAFEQFNMGEGAAIAGLNFLFLLIVVVLYLWITRRWVRA